MISLSRIFRVTLSLAILLSAMAISIARAQDTEPHLSYGDSLQEFITNQTFEHIYYFEGQAGDVIVLTMYAMPESQLSPYLYLTTLSNEILARTGDYYDRPARIITRLPFDGTYQIVATRIDECAGTTEGAFTLTLDKALTHGSGITMEGTVYAEEIAPIYVFVPEQAGVYTITYTRVRGEYFPAVAIEQITEGHESSPEEIALLSGRTLHSGALMLELNLDAIYIFTLKNSYYGYNSFNAATVYTITVELDSTDEGAE